MEKAQEATALQPEDLMHNRMQTQPWAFQSPGPASADLRIGGTTRCEGR